jgi:hypothetical protein
MGSANNGLKSIDTEEKSHMQELACLITQNSGCLYCPQDCII